MEKNWDKLQSHIYFGMCGGDTKRFNWFMTWMAHIIQFPQDRWGVRAVAVNGPSGSGKSTIFNYLCDVLWEEESRIALAPARDVFGGFSSVNEKTLLVVLEGWNSAAHEINPSAFKSLLMDDYFVKEMKGKNAALWANNMRFALLTSEKDWQPCDRRIVNFAMDDDPLLDKKVWLAKVHAQMSAGGLETFKEEVETWVTPPENCWACLCNTTDV